MVRCMLPVALVVYGAACCLGTSSRWCSLEDSKVVGDMFDETNRNLDPQTVIEITTDAFVRYVANVLVWFDTFYIHNVCIILAKGDTE